ncbi:hypothetical protein HAX54_026996 [Datura stramonium]|uniref:C2H2-type domain-containing protein n=1 Tax=Datura stramonium TaxID=4076 RepID=A0ABS8S8D7_DATST|nr:hypothetical protein [Datura stramonium]
MKKTKVDNENRVDESEVEFVPNKLVKGSGSVMSQMDSDPKENSSKIKFECTTCNKSFHSYQALGGHRASHKNTKAENCTSIDIDHIRTAAKKLELMRFGQD